MILPVTSKLNQNYNNSLRNNLKQNSNIVPNNSMQLSGVNNPMKSYISFGWCTAHYQAMYEIDLQQSVRLHQLKQIEQLKQQKQERYSIYDTAAVQAAKIISQYSNLMFTVAEVPPSFALQNAKKFKDAIEKSETLSNPLTLLTSINNIAKTEVKNDDLTPIRKERAKGATQLYSIAILLDKIEEKKNQPEFQHILTQINSLSDSVRESIKRVYGDDIFEKIEYFGSLSEHPSDKDKRAALDFIIEVDSKAESLKLPFDFEKKLIGLLDKQNDFEGRTKENTIITEKPLKIKLNYPDHDHNPADFNKNHDHIHEHNHTHSHEYMHEHGIAHTHEENIKETNVQK